MGKSRTPKGTTIWIVHSKLVVPNEFNYYSRKIMELYGIYIPSYKAKYLKTRQKITLGGSFMVLIQVKGELKP